MSRRVLIAHVPYEVRGGEDVHVEALAEAYHRLGYEPHFFPSVRTAPKRSLAAIGRSLLPAAESPEIAAEWDRLRPEFIHLHNAFPILGPSFFRWAIDHSIPVAMTVHNHRFFCTNGLALRDGHPCKDCFESKIAWRPMLYNCNGDRQKTAYHAAAMTEMRVGDLYRRAVRRFIAPSPYIRNELIRFGVREEQVVHILNPVETGPEPLSTEPFQYDVLFAGRLSQEKGLVQLLAAFEHLPDVSLAIVGEGPERSRIEDSARGRSNIKILGALPRENVIKLIRQSRIGVLPSICNEILPTFVLECFAQGRRCVLSSQESVAWLTEGEFPGKAADIWNPDEFASAISATLRAPSPSPSEINSIRERLDVGCFARSLERLIDEIAPA